MRIPFIELLRKFQLLAIIACGTLPAILVLAGHHGAALLPFIWLFPAGYLILATVFLLVPGKYRLGGAIAVCFVILVTVILKLSYHELLVGIAAVAIYSVLLLWSLQMASWSSAQEIPGLWVTAGIVVHLGGQLFLHMDRVSGEMRLERVSGWITGSFFVFFFLTMLSQNRKSLIQAAGKRQKATGIMDRKNKLLTFGLFLVGLAASAAPSVWRWIKAGLQKLWQMLLALIELLASDYQGEETAAPPLEQPSFTMESGGEAGAFAKFTEKVIIVIGALIAAVIIGYLFFRLGKFLTKLLRQLFKMLSRYAANASEDYEDEITDTREGESVYSRVQKYFSQRLSLQEERSMEPRERIRYRYKLLSLRHSDWRAGSTARENLPQELAGIYERARYSDSKVSAEEAERFSRGMKGI